MRYVVALGMFDGVHQGHQALLSHTAELAEEHGATAVAFTYQNHPKALFGGVNTFLAAPHLRERLMRISGVERVDAVRFDAEFAAKSPETFVAELKERYRELHTVVVGFDFRFGAKAKGTPERLRELGTAHGFSVSVVPPVLFEGAPCGSTRVREVLDKGDVETAARMLGRLYRLDGIVEQGKHRGSGLGFPTANLDVKSLYLPKDGVYASALLVDGMVYRAVTNIGTNPTYQNAERTVETHVLDGATELYGKSVAVFLLRFIREEQRFSSREELIRAIASDVETAKKVFEKHKKSVYNDRTLC